MADRLRKKDRSSNMAAIKSMNTKPEMIVRRLTHGMGYRYRLHVRGLSGKPDLVFRSRQKIIFVNGCFWHQHPDPDCKDARLPKSNLDYWKPKLSRNAARDKDNVVQLAQNGWDVLIIWECETKHIDALANRIRAFLE